MLPTIRPSGVAPAPADAARAAQRAFFSQALNAVQAPESPLPAPVAEIAAAAPVRRQAAPVEVNRINIPDREPERPMRPGSLLDIRI